MKVLLDTHVWIWWLTGSSSLKDDERDALNRLAADRALGLSAISLWEAQMLHQKRRFHPSVAFADWLELAGDEQVIKVVPLDVAVVCALDQLPARFEGDPADRVIVATAKANRAPVATHDHKIRSSRVVEIWRP